MAAESRREIRWPVLAFGAGAFFMCYLGQVVLGVIQPPIQSELRLSQSEAQWIINAFMLTLALFAAPAGHLGDQYGHRNVLILGLALFGVGSLSAAIATDFLWLVVSLGAIGIGAAGLIPLSAALVANSVSLDVRGKTMGLYQGLGTSVFVIGPIMAGVFAAAVNWRLLFWVVLALAVGLIVVGLKGVPDERFGSRRPFDASGFAIGLIGLAAVLIAIMQALSWGWHAPPTLTLLAVGVGILAIFATREWRSDHPLLDVRLLAKPAFLGIVLGFAAAQFALNSVAVYMATYFQHILGFSALLAGVGMLTMALPIPPGSEPTGRIVDRMGARTPALVGLSLFVVGLIWLGTFSDYGSYWSLLPGLLAVGIGIPLSFTSLLTAMSNAVEAEKRGNANALVLTIRWVMAALATMVLGVVIDTIRTEQVRAHFVENGLPTSDVERAVALLSDSKAVQIERAREIGPGVLDAIKDATTTGYATAFFVAAGVAIMGLLAVAILIRNPRNRPPSQEHQ